jgi:outer membrane protein insertion porin family
MYFPEGTTIFSSVVFGLLYSSLDSRVDPREGAWLNIKQEIAGLGGDVSYLKTEGEGRIYAELLPDADIVGFVKVAGGTITG